MNRAIASANVTDVASLSALRVHVVDVRRGSADAALKSFRTQKAVASVERDARVAPSDIALNDFRWRDSWALPKIHTPKAWSVTTGSSNIVVAVLDSGADFQQPDLQGAFVPGRDIYNNDADPSDDNGHGTGAAGVIAARSDNGVGVTSICGGCSLMPIKIAGRDGYATWSAMASGITWAVNHGARIISVSFASPTGSTTVASAIQYARSHNALVFASAGNYSSSAPHYPAASPGAIAVASTNESDGLESYSNYGSWVQVAAPGCSYSTLWTAANSNPYNYYCGTSAAAPAAAAVAALALSFNPSATADQVEQALYGGTASVGSFVKYGRVDALGTLTALGATAPAQSSAPALRVGKNPVLLLWPGNALTTSPQPGQILAASSAGWTGSVPLSFTWTWSRCDATGANCSVVASSTASTYTVATADSGYTLRAVLTATNSSGSASAISTPSGPVGGAATTPAPPSPISSPTISGVAQEGQTLTASTGTWSGSPTGYGYQWQRCDGLGSACAPIATATSASYVAGSADVGATLRVAVTASNTAGGTTAVSASTSVIGAQPEPTPAASTVTYTGSISAKRPAQSFDISLPTGGIRAELAFAKCTRLGLELRNAGGSVKSTAGPSVVTLTSTTSAGTYSLVVSGDSVRGACSFTLTATATG